MTLRWISFVPAKIDDGLVVEPRPLPPPSPGLSSAPRHSGAPARARPSPCRAAAGSSPPVELERRALGPDARRPWRAGTATASCAAGRGGPRRRPRRAAAASAVVVEARRARAARRSSSSSSWAWITSWRGFVPRSWVSVERRHPPAVVDGADHAVVGHEDVVEEDLVELGLAGGLHERPHLDAGGAHVDREGGDARAASGTSSEIGVVRARHRPQSANWA